MSCYDCRGPNEVECPDCATAFCYIHWMVRRAIFDKDGHSDNPAGCFRCGAEL